MSDKALMTSMSGPGGLGAYGVTRFGSTLWGLTILRRTFYIANGYCVSLNFERC